MNEAERTLVERIRVDDAPDFPAVESDRGHPETRPSTGVLLASRALHPDDVFALASPAAGRPLLPGTWSVERARGGAPVLALRGGAGHPLAGGDAGSDPWGALGVALRARGLRMGACAADAGTVAARLWSRALLRRLRDPNEAYAARVFDETQLGVEDEAVAWARGHSMNRVPDRALAYERNGISDPYVPGSILRVPQADRIYVALQAPGRGSRRGGGGGSAREGARRLVDHAVRRGAAAIVTLSNPALGDSVREDEAYWTWEEMPLSAPRLLPDSRVEERRVLVEGASRPPVHLFFPSWPDMRLPTSAADFAALLRRLRAPDLVGREVFVHCAAGLGRTGTLVLADILIGRALRCARSAGELPPPDPAEVLRAMRAERAELVLTAEQAGYAMEAAAVEVAGAVG